MNLEKFADENDIFINVYIISVRNNILPVITPNEKERHVNLLLLTKIDEKMVLKKCIIVILKIYAN